MHVPVVARKEGHRRQEDASLLTLSTQGMSTNKSARFCWETYLARTPVGYKTTDTSSLLPGGFTARSTSSHEK